MAVAITHPLVAIAQDERRMVRNERAKARYAIDPERRRKQQQANKKWYQKNRERLLIQSREYQRKRHTENPEHVRSLQYKWNAANRERIATMRAIRRPRYKDRERAYAKGWIQQNKEHVRQYVRDNREKLNARYRAWSKANPDKEAARAARRRAMRLRATPSWANAERIADLYSIAEEVSRSSGIRHHVDHIVPLKGQSVCGLHCEGNLRVIPWMDNVSKGNKWL